MFHKIKTLQLATAANHATSGMVIPVFLLLLIASTVPVLIVEVPALGNYVNHLSRMHVIATIDEDSLLAQFYAIKWGLIPKLIMDLSIPFLAHYVDIYLAGKLFIILTITLLMTGVFALHYALYRELSLSPLVAFLFVYNYVLLLGFLSYLFGVGIALWGTAAWIALREHHPVLRSIVSLSCVIVLFFCHLYALGLYGLTLLCFEAWTLWQQGIRDRRKLIVDALIFGAPFLIVLPFLLASPTGELVHKVVWKPVFDLYTLQRIFEQAVNWTIDLYHFNLDRTIGVFLVGGVCWGLWRGRLRIHPVGWIVLFTGAVIFMLMPDKLFGVGAVRYRLPIAILFIVIAFAHWQISKPSARMMFTSLIAAVALVRISLVSASWMEIDRSYTELRQAFAQIERGSTLLSVQIKEPRAPFNRAWPLNYADCLAIIDRSSFAPSAFTHKGKHILTTNPPYSRLARKDDSLVPSRNEIVSVAHNPNPAPVPGDYWATWTKDFDYLLVLYTNAKDSNPLPDQLSLLYHGEQFQLYEIKPVKIHRSVRR
jgi:hypothetical protein